MSIKGLDGWHTFCRIVDHGIDPRIIIEARNGSLGVQLGDFNCRQALELADMIVEAVKKAQSLPFVGNVSGGS